MEPFTHQTDISPQHKRELLFERLSTEITLGVKEQQALWGWLATCGREKLDNILERRENLANAVGRIVWDTIGLAKGWTQKDLQGRGGRRVIKLEDRSKSEQKTAMERDEGACVVTRRRVVDAAHIFPHYLVKKIKVGKNGETTDIMEQQTNEVYTKRRQFFERMRRWIGDERTDEWIKAVYGENYDENQLEARDTTRNLLCLEPTLHRMWTRAGFALEAAPQPVQGDAGVWSLQLRMVWLPNEDWENNKVVSRDVMKPGGKHPDMGDYTDRCKNDITTGYTFKISSTSKDLLPDARIINMQFAMQMLVAISGAGEREDDTPSDEDSDDGEPLE